MKKYILIVAFTILSVSAFSQVKNESTDSLSVKKNDVVQQYGFTGELIETDSITVSNTTVQNKSSANLINEEISQSNEVDKGKDLNTLEIDGLIVDETKTKAGRDFYEYFYNNWTAPKGAHDYSIIIREMPFRMSSTKIIILLNDEHVVFESPLQQRYEATLNLCKASMGRLHHFMTNYQKMVQDLGGGDQFGSGIY
ncbi:MAG: hypothetical protein KAG96_08020 [Ichthyobacteriaceae bacterium]|nr:hypothetical protein [Ichthyobacteriaceae bacterium]